MSNGTTPSGFERLRELAARAGKPIGVHLQVADRCNHHCGHCYQIQGRKGELSLEEVKAILDDLASAGVLMLNVSGGEATLRPDLIAILEHAHARGFATRLYTNAYLVDDALADGIARTRPLEVHVSVYSDRAQEHDAVTQVPGSFERTLDGIERLRRRGVRVVMKTPLLRLAPGARRRVAALAERLGCAHRFSAEITPAEDGSLAPKSLETPAEALLADGVLLPWQPSDRDADLRAEKLASACCGVCRASVTVLPNGDVLPCTDTIVPLGNLRRQRFADLYRESRPVGLFTSLTWSDVHGCRDCDLLLACSRCHASALHEQGDYLGPYASACGRAVARYAAAVGPVKIVPTESSGETPMGPFRIEAPGRLRPMHDRTSSRDERRVAEFPFLRTSRRSGALVPLRTRATAPGIEE